MSIIITINNESNLKWKVPYSITTPTALATCNCVKNVSKTTPSNVYYVKLFLLEAILVYFLYRTVAGEVKHPITVLCCAWRKSLAESFKALIILRALINEAHDLYNVTKQLTSLSFLDVLRQYRIGNWNTPRFALVKISVGVHVDIHVYLSALLNTYTRGIQNSNPNQWNKKVNWCMLQHYWYKLISLLLQHVLQFNFGTTTLAHFLSKRKIILVLFALYTLILHIIYTFILLIGLRITMLYNTFLSINFYMRQCLVDRPMLHAKKDYWNLNNAESTQSNNSLSH